MTVVFFVPFGIFLFALCVVERLIHVFLGLFAPRASKEGSIGSQLVVGSVINIATSTFSSIVAIFMNCMYSIGWMAIWFLVVFCLCSVWYVMYEEYPQVVVHFVGFYNARIGPFVYTYMLLPLEFINVVFKCIAPLYNGFWWILRSVTSRGLLPILWDQFHILVSMASAFLNLGKHTTESLVAFGNGFECGAGECLEKPAVIDIVTPMDDVRLLGTLSSGMAGAVCSLIATPVDLALYPLRDLNFARGVHSLINAAVHMVIHVPHSTLRRCELFGGTGANTDVLMCTPDLEPVFTQLVSGLRDMGSALDNWAGIGISMARRSLSGIPDSCTIRTLSIDSFRVDGMLTGATTVVGMTDWLMATTNGSLAYFFGQINTDVAPRVWPDVVNVRMGVAAVTYSDVGNMDASTLTQGRRPGSRQTTTLLGCQCYDSDAGIRVLCTLLPMSGTVSAADSSMEVWFQDRVWSSKMKCESVEISVRSVRWPVRRYEGKSVPFGAGIVDLPNGDCLTQGTCESIDATIWLVPRCDLLPPEQCSSVAMGTSCFPFCVAVRVAGSKNANPVFANAETWRTGKQLLMRDCALQGGTTETAQVYDSFFLRDGGGASSMGFGSTTMSGASSGAPLFVRGDGTSCSVGVNTASWVPSSVGSKKPENIFSYVRQTGQPFVIAGDTILLEYPQSDGGTLVEVERLTGDQRDEYTLKKGWYGLPAAPKRLVPMDELGMDVRDRIVVPLEYAATRVVATSSRNYVFYAVNPDLQIFEAYLDYCRDRSQLPRIQLMALSSYGPMRVYRVRAYCEENCNNNWADLSAQYTFQSFSNGVFTEQTFKKDCGMVYNASIETLEYVNEQNIAVVVQVADRTYDVKTRSGTGSTYKTYWLNPRTMAVRNDTMWTSEVPSSLSVSLCAAGDSVPHLGTLVAEMGVAAVHVVNVAVGAFVYTPGLMALWMGGGACPVASHGHSVLASCGDSVFNLDDYFDSIDDATAVFWGTLIWLADQLEQGSLAQYSPVGDLLHGMGIFGKEFMEITDVKSGILSMLNTPVPEEVAGVWATVRDPGSVTGAAKIALGATSMARYTSRFLKQVSTDLVRTSVIFGSMSFEDVWLLFTGVMYDLRPYYKATVTESANNACMGLLVMLGGSSPWARLVYHTCQVAPALLDGAMEVTIHMFVDAPMVKCVCKDSAGHNIGAYARENCVPKAPQTLKPILLGMIAAADGRGSDSLMCPAVIAYTRDAMGASMTPWFNTVFATLDALGDSVDYAMIGFDEDAGQCMNFHQDPQVVVIMPEPVDYFQACGATTMCKTRCAATWDAFNREVLNRDSSSLRSVKQVEYSVESLFFPAPGVDIVAPGTIVALTQPGVCGVGMCRDVSDGCLAVASTSGTVLKVSYYCIPRSPSSSAYPSENLNLNWASPIGYDASQVGFLDEDGRSLVTLVGANIFLLERGSDHKVVVSVNEIYSLDILSMYPMRIVDFLMVHDRILVNVAVRTSNGAEFERSMATLWVNPRDGGYGWPMVVTQSMRGVWNGYVSSEYPRTSGDVAMLLMWPVTPTGAVQRVLFKYSNTSVEVQLVQPFQQGDSLLARASLMPRMLVLGKTLRVETGRLAVFASSGSTYDWLQQLRLMGNDLALNGASLGNSQSVGANVSIVTQCDGLDCRGCPDLGIRALCASYQSCAVFRCIGTPVNLKRPLCGIGQVLRSTGMLEVEMIQGGWIMFVDIYMILLQLSTQQNVPGVDVSFPEDAFLGKICVAKDLSAEFFGIIASTVNSALQKSQIPTVSLQNVAQLDSGANTMLSMSTAAVTGFINQFAMAPIYVLAVGHKILMCEVSGLLAVTSSVGFQVDIMPVRFSGTDAIGGQCLTRGGEMDVQQTGDAGASRGVSMLVGALLTANNERSSLRRLESALHIMDGIMAYSIGMVGKFADLLQTFDMRQCILPDVTIKRTVQCACGDTALSVLPVRSSEGVSDFAYWCSGTISLVDSNNKMRIVWNPYTYQELQGKLSGVMDTYLETASSNVIADAPNDRVFTDQGVSMIAVLTRCRQNFVNKQWDPAAFAQYNQDTINKEIVGGALRTSTASEDGVGDCLLASFNAGVGNGACLDAFLKNLGLTSSTYWGYVPTDSVAANLIDACLVFSGPASNMSVSLERRAVFQNCLSGFAVNGSRCDLSGFVWSPASSNDVPVAARHVIVAQSNSQLDAVGQRMAAARDMVLAELDKLAEYENTELEAAMFSAEGDIIHQLMDCVFMGPFARMDYWPSPRCNESETPDCLVGPYWSRDNGGGATRKLDIETCPASETLPFTCGSPARRAMVKDFVQRFLQAGKGGSTMLLELIRTWLDDQRGRWSNITLFGCDCPAGSPASNDVACCAMDVGTHLPRTLAEIPLYLPTQSIMNAIEQRMKQFYMESLWSPESWTTHLSSSESLKYDWGAAAGSHRVEQDARFETTNQTRKFTKDEALNPPRNLAEPGLWQACHGALRQVLFTIPVGDNGMLRDTVPDFPGGGPDAIASHIKKIVVSAFEASPLFRHYQPRHHPSESRMCEGAGVDSSGDGGSVTFGDYKVNGNLILDGKRLAGIPVLGFEFSPIGSWNSSCFCGWRLSAGRCTVPSSACLDVSSIVSMPVTGCTYLISDQDMHALGSVFRPGTWKCPLLELSEHLGFLDTVSTEHWLWGDKNLFSSGEFILRYGPGGLKIGNAPVIGGTATMADIGLGSDFPTGDLAQVLRQYLTPDSRQIDPSLGVLHGCREHENTAGSTNYLLDKFMEGLFPMAQGVSESGVGAYCLRYALELGRLQAMELMRGIDHVIMVQQKEVLATWRRRCGSQVQLVGLCNALDMYHRGEMQPIGCLQSWQIVLDPNVDMYITPQCLVKMGDFFYDPCGCNPSWCESSDTPVIITQADLQVSQCRMKFDPRTVVRAAEMGWWGVDEVNPVAAEANDWLAEPWNMLDMNALRASLLSNGQGVGNTPQGKHWATAEGFLNDTGLFCDAIADYWPEQWLFPVGYHVTVQCDQADIGYRSFDNVFALDDVPGQPFLVFMEDQTRDGELVDSHFGAGGVCRGSNFGFDMYETNTMRVCTRTVAGEDVDVHVPKGDNPPGTLGNARCSLSSTELPWGDERYYDFYDSVFYSVGTVPNLPSSEAKTYPETSDRYMRLGPQNSMEIEHWGATCQDFVLPNCSTGEWKCPDGYVCRGKGVCQHPKVECTEHGECPNNKMCSGVGTCITPRITVENDLGVNVSFRAHTTQCSGQSFSMRGASSWGYLPDILDSHGMCSYRHWQEYLYTLDQCRCNSTNGNEVCSLNGTTCKMYKFANVDDSNMWWNPTNGYPNRLKMIPTTCDRDYERFSVGGREMLSCVPSAGKVRIMDVDNTYKLFAERDSMWKVYDDTKKTVALRLMPFRKNVTFGFLGFSSEPTLKSCTSVQQCYVDEFTKNGKVAMIRGLISRADRTLLDGTAYNPDHTFRCGVIGFFNASIGLCQIDRKLFPIYHLMCFGTSGLDHCLPAMKLTDVGLARMCQAVMDPYPLQYNIIHDVNVPALTALFSIFKSSTTLQEHFDTVRCINYIYGTISKPPFDSRGLYIPYTFTVYEIPFSWFYQCIVGLGMIPPVNFDKIVQRCQFYEAHNTIQSYVPAVDGRLTDFSSYVFYVRGGYNESLLNAQVNAQLAIAQDQWRGAVEDLRRSLYGQSEDRSYPVCFTQKRWDLPSDNFYKLKLMETYERQSCSSNARGAFLERYRVAYNRPNVTLTNLVDELTVDTAPVVVQDVGVWPLLTRRILKFGLDQLQKNAGVGKLVTDSPPVSFNASLPSSTSMDYTLIRDQWKVVGGYMPNSADVLNPVSGDCPSTEIRIQLFTGKFADFDTDKLAGLESRVDICPLYTTGLLGCEYEDITVQGVQYSLKGTDVNRENSFNAFVDAMYHAAKVLYDSRMRQHSLGVIPFVPMPWFEDEANLFFGDHFQFDLTNIATYMNNIDPDVKAPIMCMAGNQTINYNDCTDDNYKAIRSHVETNFAKDAGVLIPDRKQLDWDVSREMMAMGAIFSFASAERDTSKQYLKRLFDDSTVCQASQLSHSERLCSFTGSGVLQVARSVSPWMNGGWNPYDQCDVTQMSVVDGNTEKIDVQCHYSAYCPDDRPFDLTVPYYRDMPYGRSCIARNDEKTKHMNVDARSPYNLCQHSLVEDTVCQHSQGMLGGTDGMPSEDNSLNGDLYTLHEFDAIPEGDGGPFGNVLLAGRSSNYGFVRIPLEHIGGHQLGMVINNGTMRVTRMPLKPVRDGARMGEWDTYDVTEWVEVWNASMEADDVLYTESARDLGFVIGQDADGRPRLGWDCPLRRRAFYNGDVKGFGPSLPSARRSRRLFSEVNGDRYAHPTQKRKDGSGQFGRYLTTNGFCMCPLSENVWPGMCSVKTELGNEHNCSLFSTVKAVKGEAWGWSHTFRPKTSQNEYKTCSVQLDWPFVAGTLRDGSTLLSTDVDDTVWNGASDVESRRCHVLDRIPDFAYVYASRRELKPSGFTTLDRGVCHTGRVQAQVDNSKRCIRVNKGDSGSILRCAGSTGSSTPTNANAERRTSKRASDSASMIKHYRKACSRCTKPPLFRTRGGRSLKAESSFGLPYRVSTERVLAQDLREALCGDSAECIGNLNASAWKVGEFMRTYLENPVGLFKPGYPVKKLNVSQFYVPKTDQQPDDSALWAKPWVYCPSKEALATGVNCTGSIKKPRWRQDKVHACYTSLEIALQGQPDPMAKTQVCELDGRLGTLCRVIREAQSLVASANCLASGSDACALQEFVYTPATWETTNQMFVHQTVEEYYKRVDGCVDDSSCICGTDPSLSEFRKNNANTFEHCSAVPVVAFQRVLVAVRGMIVPVVKAAAIALNIVMHLILTMVQSGFKDAGNQVLLDWAEIKRLLSGATGIISDLIFDLAFSTGTLGPWLKTSIMSACNTINEVYGYVSKFWCSLVVVQLPGFLGALREIGGWVDVGFDTLNDIVGVILYDFLPAALMELYQYGYNSFFQSEKYRQKQKNYDDRVRLNLVNPDGQRQVMTPRERQQAAANRDNKVLKNLISAKKGKNGASVNGILGSIASALGSAGPLSKIVGVAGIIDVAISGYQAVTDYQKAMEFASMLEKFPTSFTLFDFDSFYAVIDSFVLYLNSDMTCYSMVDGLSPLQCSVMSLAEPSKVNVVANTPRASSCWAEAPQRQVGVSTLYACSSTSTCCLDATSCDVESNSRMCGECPATMVGVLKFGCNTMIQKCQCGVESFEVDRCVAQRDCGPTSSCSLLASLDDMSFGAIKSCTGCTTSPICLFSGSQHYGQCSCLSGANAKVDLCGVSVGTLVSANPSRLCGYSADPGTYFAWAELSLAMCVNVISPVCSEVVTESGGSIFMPVSSRLRSVQVSFGGRRLLSTDGSADAPLRIRLPSVFSPEDPAEDLTPEVLHAIVTRSKWNHTNAPCGPLAHAYIQGHVLGPVDETTLHACVYWRVVARQIIEDYRLDSLEQLDTFLLSPDDLAASIGQQGVLEQLLRNPQALLVASMYSPWLKPVRAFLVASHGANVSRLLSGWANHITNKTAWKMISRRLFGGRGRMRYNAKNMSRDGFRGRMRYNAKNMSQDGFRGNSSALSPGFHQNVSYASTSAFHEKKSKVYGDSFASQKPNYEDIKPTDKDDEIMHEPSFFYKDIKPTDKDDEIMHEPSFFYEDIKPTDKDDEIMHEPSFFSNVTPGGRRLMSVWEDAEKQVKTLPFFSYTSNITVFFIKNSSVGLKNAQSLLRDAVSWQYISSQSYCKIVEPLFASSMQVLHVLKMYYSKFTEISTPRKSGSRLGDILPTFKFPAWFNFTIEPNLNFARNTGSVLLSWVIGLFGVTERDLIAFMTEPCPDNDCAASNLWTFDYLTESIGHCDFESVMYCSKYKRDMFTSLVFAVLIYVLFSFVASYVGLSSLVFAFFYALPLFVLWLSTGVAPGCLPMIPTCLFDDVLATVKAWVPPETSVPSLLVLENGTSLRSCTELSFTSWEDPLTFLICDAGFCDGMNDISFVGGTRWNFAQKRASIASPDAGAHRLCASVTAIYVVPVVMALSVGVALASSLVVALVSLIPPLAGLVWQVTVYNHQHDELSIDE